MLRAEAPEDYVIATGETHSVREFCEIAFARAGMPLAWRGEGVEEQGVAEDGRVLVTVDSRHFRKAEVPTLRGDASLARERLGWRPRVAFRQLGRDGWSTRISKPSDAADAPQGPRADRDGRGRAVARILRRG